MEGPEKWLSPSKSTVSPIPSSTGENNENDPSQDNKLIPKFQNQKKSAAKHFMSPTISAASKFAPPRKNILSERNENSSNSDVETKKSPRNSRIRRSNRPSSQVVSSYDRASEPDDDCDTEFLDGSFVKAYDPFTNYLSPRPKYLRFNPNKRREIFSRLEKEENDSFDSQEVNGENIKDSSFSPRKESDVKPANEENSVQGDEKGVCSDYEEDEEEEEIEEERGWCFKGVLKFLLTLIACVLSTSCICTMNSPSPMTTQQALWKLKDGCLMIKRPTFEAIGMTLQEDGFLKMEVRDEYGEFEEGEYDEDYNGENAESVEVIEDGIENLEEIEIDEDEDWEIEERVDVENLGSADNELVENGTGYSVDNEIDKAVEIDGDQFEVIAESFDQFVDANTDESINARLQKEVESSYLALSDNKVDKTEAPESEIKPKTDESENAGEYDSEMEIKAPDQLHEKSPNSGHEVEIEQAERKNDTAIIGFSAVSLILAALAIIIVNSLKKPRTTTSPKNPDLVLKPHNKLAVEDRRKIEFFARPPSLHSNEEAPKKSEHHIHAPTIELIGEVVVGQVSNRIRKYEAESEEENSTYLPKHGTTSQPILASTQPCELERSNSSSCSYGSFTTETKILKKEGGRQSAEAVVEVTPVRRSSRLRSRAAVSPQ